MIVLRWRQPEPAIRTRWRGPDNAFKDAVARGAAAPLADVIFAGGGGVLPDLGDLAALFNSA